MANTVFKLRRSSVAGKYPNTSTLSIAELAINLTDRKLFSSDGANVFVLGSNLDILHVQDRAIIHSANLIGNTTTHNTATFFGNVVLNGGVSAGGSYGNSGLFLTSNGSAVYWASTTTDVNIPHIIKTATGNGIRTSFAITGGYDANYLNVYLNGVRMTDAEANTASGANVEFAVAPVSNSKIDFIGYELDASDGVYVKQSYVGDGTINQFTVANGYTSNALNVYLNGIRATGTEVNTASGANIVFAVAPANGTTIDIFGVKNLNPEANFVIQSFIGDGATDTFSTTLPYNPERLNVYLNGVRMGPDEINIINGVDIVFVVPPVLNSIIDVYGIYVPSSSAVNTADTYTWTNNHYWGSTTSGAAVNSSVISLGNSSVNVFINSSSIYVGGVAIGGNVVATINTAGQYTWTNTQTFTNTITFSQTINATSNSALFIGSLPAANVVSNAQLSSNLANYQTSAGLSANVAKLTANNTSFVGTVSAANVVSNAQLQGNVTTLQTYADNKAANAYSNAVSDASTDATNKAANAYSNAVSYTDAKAGNAYSNAVIFASNASNINTGTLAEARLPYRMDQNLTTTNNVIFGNLTLTGNLTVSGTSTVLQGNNITFTDNMLYLNQGVSANITNISGNGTQIIFTANNNYSAGWDVSVTNVDPSSYNGDYQNIISANGTHFVVANTNTASYISGGTARGKSDVNPDIGLAAGYNDGTYRHAGFFRDASDGYWKVFDSYLPEPDANVYIDTSNSSFKLSNFQANVIAVGNTSTNWAVINTSGIFAGSTLVGNSTGPYGKTEGNLNVNSALTSNNSTNLGGVAAASYVNTAGAYTITGVHTYNANVVIASGSGVSANGGFGSNGQALTSNGSAVYWSTIVGTNTAAQYTWTNNHTFSANVALNGFVNSPIKMSSSPFIEMTVNISSDYTVSNNYNALTVGPVTIDSGITVTVPSGSTWTIV
jgi:hypothetical protein